MFNLGLRPPSSLTLSLCRTTILTKEPPCNHQSVLHHRPSEAFTWSVHHPHHTPYRNLHNSITLFSFVHPSSHLSLSFITNDRTFPPPLRRSTASQATIVARPVISPPSTPSSSHQAPIFHASQTSAPSETTSQTFHL